MSEKELSWTPKEPKRPFQPKPGAFGTSHSIPKSQIDSIRDQANAEDLINGKWDDLDSENQNSEFDGPAV